MSPHYPSFMFNFYFNWIVYLMKFHHAKRNSFSDSLSLTTQCTLWKYSFFSSSSSLFFFCYTWVFILFMCFMRSIKFSICAWHSAFTRHSVYLCKNETIEICCMATRYGETSSIKTEYTIFFPPRLVPYFFFCHLLSSVPRSTWCRGDICWKNLAMFMKIQQKKKEFLVNFSRFRIMCSLRMHSQ